MAKNSSKAKRLADLAGAPPKMATADDLEAAGADTSSVDARQRSYSTKVGATEGISHRINLKAVSEACIDAGLDPAVEIARVLREKVPLRDRQGMPVLDEKGEPIMVDRIDPDTRLRTLNELLQYTQPKLKAVEVKMSGALELSGEQLDQRLAALIAKATK